MKSLKESILDNNLEQKTDNMVELYQVWKDLTETYGPMLRGYDKFGCTVDNIAFDKKGRIIFVNWPMDTIDFDMQIDGMPDSVLKRGFGKFTKNVDVYGLWGAGTKGCKLSSLGFITRSETRLSIRGGKVDFDKFIINCVHAVAQISCIECNSKIFSIKRDCDIFSNVSNV